MKRVACLAVLLCLNSCWAFQSTDTKPALEANVAQKVVFENHSAAFEKIVLASNATPAVKTAIVGAMQKDRNDFVMFNAALQSYLTAIGDIDASDIISIGLKTYKDYRKAVEEKEDGK